MQVNESSTTVPGKMVVYMYYYYIEQPYCYFSKTFTSAPQGGVVVFIVWGCF